MAKPSSLTQDEISKARKAFQLFDKDRSGAIDSWELRAVWEELGFSPTEEDLFRMITEYASHETSGITFPDFLHMIEANKLRSLEVDSGDDTLDAFIACGGNPDKSGYVPKETLLKIIKEDFGLQVDIERLISQIDRADTGKIAFPEFKLLVTGKVKLPREAPSSPLFSKMPRKSGAKSGSGRAFFGR